MPESHVWKKVNSKWFSYMTTDGGENDVSKDIWSGADSEEEKRGLNSFAMTAMDALILWQEDFCP